jgi:hypothetical protein
MEIRKAAHRAAFLFFASSFLRRLRSERRANNTGDDARLHFS